MTTGGDVVYVVTAWLLVGDRPAQNFQSTAVASLQEAVDVMKAKGTARLPSGSWELASLVLQAFGASKDEAANQVHFARTGRLLSTP